MGWGGSKAGLSGWDWCNWGYYTGVTGVISAIVPEMRDFKPIAWLCRG